MASAPVQRLHYCCGYVVTGKCGDVRRNAMSPVLIRTACLVALLEVQHWCACNRCCFRIVHTSCWGTRFLEMRVRKKMLQIGSYTDAMIFVTYSSHMSCAGVRDALSNGSCLLVLLYYCCCCIHWSFFVNSGLTRSILVNVMNLLLHVLHGCCGCKHWVRDVNTEPPLTAFVDGQAGIKLCGCKDGMYTREYSIHIFLYSRSVGIESKFCSIDASAAAPQLFFFLFNLPRMSKNKA